MLKLNTLFIIIAMMINPVCRLYGQGRILEGKVLTFETVPVVGASIKVKSNDEVVFTDSLGRFSISCNTEDKLKITAKGFFDKNLKIEDTTKYASVNLALKPGSHNLEKAIANRHITHSQSLYSMTSPDGGGKDYSHYTTIYQIIQEEFPELRIANGRIIIRGQSSMSGSNSALLVVDGTIANQGYFQSLPPATIESISVLKGPETSIYGSRGANGVVVVKTKSGL